jgi:hypothetical protein
MDLDAYRRSAEEFVSGLTGAYYRHYAGLNDDYEIEPIYARHAQLFELGSVLRLRELAAGASAGSDERRRLGMLLDFATEGFLGAATKEQEAELARREAAATIEIGRERIGFRESATVQANEPDASRRAAIEQGRLDVIESELGALHRELTERQHEGARELGYASYREMCELCKGIDLGALAAQTAAFTAGTEEAYPALLEPQLQRILGVSLAELHRADLPRFFRASDEDAQFPGERLVGCLLETLQALGIAGQAGAKLDVEPRPKKSPRAFCAPVRVPDEVYLVIAPVGGRDDFAALFHEAGHTEHYAHVDRGLAFEYRYLGDNSITESFAFLLQHLIEDPIWLERRLGVTDSEQLVAYARAHRLVYLRRYAAKLAYELELHGPGAALSELPHRYAELLGGALQLDWPTETYLADVDPGFYCACYLRAWALETRLRAHLRREFGEAWFESPAAGQVLRRLWAQGQRMTPEELLSELTGERLDFTVLLDDLAIRRHWPPGRRSP